MKAWFRTIWSRAWEVVRKGRLDREFDEELTTHLELLIDEGRRRGLSDADARRDAIRKLGQPVALREVHREQRGLPALDVLAQDLRYAFRMLRKTPGFTAVVTISLALGIGANTALFCLVDVILLRSLPIREPDRLVRVQQFMPGGVFKKLKLGYPPQAFDHVREHGVFPEIVGYGTLDRADVSIDGSPEPPRPVEQVSASFFRELGVSPIVGRAPEASDDDVAVIGSRLWNSRYGASQTVLGRPLTVNGNVYSIVGVAPPQFFGLSVERPADLWISSRTPGLLQMFGWVRPGVSPAQATAAIHAALAQLPRQPGEPELQTELLPAGKGLSDLREQYTRPLLALIVLVTLVLLITCTNVGNLLTLRNASRTRDVTIRVALGARRSRLVVQYLVESAVLAVVGGLLALAFARWGVSFILAMLPLPAVPENLLFNADVRTLGFAAGVSMLSALLFGLGPALRASQVDLKLTAIRSSHGTMPTRGARRLGRLLVASQVALSILLLVGAGLFVQTLRNLSRFDVGFDPDRLLQVNIDTRDAGYRDGHIADVYRLLLERVGAVPGVTSVTAIRNPVMSLTGGLSRSSLRAFQSRLRSPREMWASADVGPAFFETMKIPLVRGRTFEAADFDQQRPLAVISEEFAKYYFPNEDPVGMTVGVTIIGIVKDTKLESARRETLPMMYMMVRKDADRVSALEARISGDPAAVAPAIAAEVRRINPRLLLGVRTMRDEIDRTIAKERMVAALSAFFSVLGLLLVSIGIFGIASYTVAQRTNEIGIRMALGAGRWSVIRESLRDTMLVFGAGLAAGVIAAIVAVRVTASIISDLLFGLTATDAANIVVAVLVMIGVACAACILPARRATRIDPLAAIRHE